MIRSTLLPVSALLLASCAAHQPGALPAPTTTSLRADTVLVNRDHRGLALIARAGL